MAVHLKKRAYEEFSHVLRENAEPKEKTIRLAKKKLSHHQTNKVQEQPLPNDQVRLNLSGKPSDRVLALLTRFSKKLPIPLHSVHECIKSLFKRFSNEKETYVRTRIIWLVHQLCFTVGYDFIPILHDLIKLLNKESSGKVLVQLWESCVSLASKINDVKTHQKLANMARISLHDSRHHVRCKCLMAIGQLGQPIKSQQGGGEGLNLHEVVSNYFTDPDPRVRCDALNSMITMHNRGQLLEMTIYEPACQAMNDDYEQVRFTATQLVWIIAHVYPEKKVPAPFTEEEIRLVDDAFAKICNQVNDSSWKVRAEAAKLLGSLVHVGDSFVFQTLDKKLMSDLKRKKSLNEQAKEGFVEEYASGNQWNDDQPVTQRGGGPHGTMLGDTTVMNSGACGAFVHGLEDEMMEVRSAAVDSLTELASQRSNVKFAQAAVDFLVDCLNDEIEAVRLNAVNSIHKIVDQVLILEDQLDNVHSAMEDSCSDIRKGIHELLSSCRLVSKACLYDTVMMLLKNLNKYPEDKESIWKTQKQLGLHHGELTYMLTSQLLSCHPFFHMPEPQMDDPCYIAILILVFNAAKICPQITQLFPEHVTRHYQYLKDSIPHLVPDIKVSSGLSSKIMTSYLSTSSSREIDDVSNKSKQFLANILNRIKNIKNEDTLQQKQILKSAIDDLNNISRFAPDQTSTSQCIRDFLQAQLLLYKSVDQKVWTNKSNSQNELKPVALKIIELTYQLQYLHLGLSANEISFILQLRFKAEVLLFVVEVQQITDNNTNNNNNSSELENENNPLAADHGRSADTLRKLSDDLFNRMRAMHAYTEQHRLEVDNFTKTCFKQLMNKTSLKPSLLVKFFRPLLANYSVSHVDFNNTVQRLKVRIDQPRANPESPIQFTSGLATPLHIVATVDNIIDPVHCIRIQLEYADSSIQQFPLRIQDVRKISAFKHQINTSVQLTHMKWTETCIVQLSLVRVVIQDHHHRVTTDDVIRSWDEKILKIGETINISVFTK